MTPYRTRSILCLLALLAGCTAPPPSDDVASAPRLRVRDEVITPMLSHDDAQLRLEPDRAVIEVERNRGIGSATVQLLEGSWPRRVVVRFEGFNSLETFEARSLDARGNVVWRWPGGRPPFTDTGRALEVLLPQAALQPGVTTIELNWIDAYRG